MCSSQQHYEQAVTPSADSNGILFFKIGLMIVMKRRTRLEVMHPGETYASIHHSVYDSAIDSIISQGVSDSKC